MLTFTLIAKVNLVPRAFSLARPWERGCAKVRLLVALFCLINARVPGQVKASKASYRVKQKGKATKEHQIFKVYVVSARP